MNVQPRHQGIDPATTAQGETAMPPADREKRPSAIAALSLSAVLVMFAVALWSRGSAPGSVTEPASAAAGVPAAHASARTQLREALVWIDGLGSGKIIPSDVTAHLAPSNPNMARVVTAAWSDLTASGSSHDPRRALRWLDGLAMGSLGPADVNSRLAPQDPKMAAALIHAWLDLRTLDGR